MPAIGVEAVVVRHVVPVVEIATRLGVEAVLVVADGRVGNRSESAVERAAAVVVVDELGR